MTDILNELDAVQRETGHRRLDTGEDRTVVLRRRYDAPIEDVWDAVTNPDRINRWFLPISGDLRLGGTYQLEGNAGGEILRCEPPRLLKVTWVFGDPAQFGVGEVELRLSPAGDGVTEFELEHAGLGGDHWAEFGPGAVGVGWDLTLLGLGQHLRGGSIADPDAWTRSPEARQFMTRSSTAWGEALKATGAATAEVDRMVENTTRAYAPDPDVTRNRDTCD